jgi:hypothetical protein
VRDAASSRHAGGTAFAATSLSLRGCAVRCPQHKWSSEERQQLLARRVLLAKYLIRSPCYDAVTR